MTRPAQGRPPSVPELVALWTRDPSPWRHFFSDEEWNQLLDNEVLLTGVERHGVEGEHSRFLGSVEVARAFWDRVLIAARKRRPR